MNPNVPFEVPQQLRELAERNVEQARAAYVSRITQFEWTPPALWPVHGCNGAGYQHLVGFTAAQ